MFRKIKCPKCGTTIDENKYQCDVCQNVVQKNIKFRHFSLLVPWKQILLFVIGFLGFQGLAYLLSFLLVTIAKTQLGYGTHAYYAFVQSLKATAYINFTSYLIVFSLLSLLIIADANELLKSFKNWKSIVAGGIGLFTILIFNLIYTNILNVIGVTLYNNANENAVNSIVYQYPLLSIVIFGLIGPITEEITYRVGLFSFFGRINKILAYAITIIVFTLIHFDFQTTTLLNELLNIPLYASAAFVLSYLYDHYGFSGSVCCHVSNNLLSIITSIALIKING